MQEKVVAAARGEKGTAQQPITNNNGNTKKLRNSLTEHIKQFVSFGGKTTTLNPALNCLVFCAKMHILSFLCPTKTANHNPLSTKDELIR